MKIWTDKGIDWVACWRVQLARLLPILAGLRALLPEGASSVTRAERLDILATLRPAESIARRIIAIAARGLVVEPSPKRASGGKRKKGTRKRPDLPAFPLFDRRKRVGPPREKKAKGFGPNIRGLDGLDPTPPPRPPVPKPDDPIDAEPLRRRMASVRAAMEDVEGYALRLARRLAGGKTKYKTAMRVGRPPGHRARHLTVHGHHYRGWRAVGELLHNANWFAWEAAKPP